MDIITMLKEDHVKVKVMLAQLEETTESAAATRLELLGQVERELRAHMEIEETSLYPAVKASASQAGVEFDHDPLAERAAARDILARLKALSACDDMWRESFSAFKEHIEHHVREKEGELFKLARRGVPSHQLAAMADQYAAMKRGPSCEDGPSQAALGADPT